MKLVSFANKVITLNTICILYINRFIQRGETHDIIRKECLYTKTI